MNVLVDTPVWSLALRRKTVDLSAPELLLTQALAELIRDGRAQLTGVSNRPTTKQRRKCTTAAAAGA